LSYRLLDTFRATFEGKRYIHRNSSLGDFVAMQLYEDLYSVGKSALLRKRIDEKERVLNAENRRRGVKARRGDGTFGELIPMATPIDDHTVLLPLLRSASRSNKWFPTRRGPLQSLPLPPPRIHLACDTALNIRSFFPSTGC